MNLPEHAVLLRVFVGESDKHQGKPLYEQITLKARELNLAGVTVLRGVMGYGANSRIHTAKLLELSLDMPMVVEIVDTEENLDRLMPFLDETVTEGLVTMEKIRVLRYRHQEKRPPVA